MFDATPMQMDQVVRINRWIGRLQGASFCLAIFVGFAWLVQMTPQ